MILAKRVLLRLLTGDCGGQFLRSSFFLRKDWCYFISYIKQNRTLNHLYVIIEVNEKSEYLPFIDTLESFEEVVETCFGYSYNENFEEKIEIFEKKWMHLRQNFNITIPKKCNIIFTHVKEFIFVKKIPLGHLSEQVVEATHSKWIQLWESSFKIRNLDSQLYGERLLSCLLKFNSRNI